MCPWVTLDGTGCSQGRDRLHPHHGRIGTLCAAPGSTRDETSHRPRGAHLEEAATPASPVTDEGVVGGDANAGWRAASSGRFQGWWVSGRICQRKNGGVE